MCIEILSNQLQTIVILKEEKKKRDVAAPKKINPCTSALRKAWSVAF